MIRNAPGSGEIEIGSVSTKSKVYRIAGYTEKGVKIGTLVVSMRMHAELGGQRPPAIPSPLLLALADCLSPQSLSEVL